MNSITDPRLRRGAGWLVAAGVSALLLLGTSRSLAAVTVANASVTNITVNAGTDSPLQAIPSSAGNPTLLTVTDKTANDGIRGIASFAINWVNTAPQSILWTGTARGAVVGGEAKVVDVNLGSVGIGVNVLTDQSGGNLNRFKIRNTSGVAAVVNIHQVW